MQFKPVFLLFGLAWLLVNACDYGVGIKTTLKDAPTTDTAVETAVPAVASFYSDTLPCADCQGIVTKIVFHPDSTYTMTELYLGKEKIPAGILGKWTQDKDVVILDAGKESLNFRIIPNALQKLNMEGKEIDSKNDYTLQEIEKGILNPREPFTTTGAYFYMADGATFTVCNIDKKYPVKTGIASQEAEKIFLDKKNKDLKSILIEADITIENVPNMDGNQQTQVIILKVRKNLGTASCP